MFNKKQKLRENCKTMLNNSIKNEYIETDVGEQDGEVIVGVKSVYSQNDSSKDANNSANSQPKIRARL